MIAFNSNQFQRILNQIRALKNSEFLLTVYLFFFNSLSVGFTAATELDATEFPGALFYSVAVFEIRR